MALWVCQGCTTAYSVGAPRCPHCGSTAYVEDGQPAAEPASEPAVESPVTRDPATPPRRSNAAKPSP